MKLNQNWYSFLRINVLGVGVYVILLFFLYKYQWTSVNLIKSARVDLRSLEEIKQRKTTSFIDKFIHDQTIYTCNIHKYKKKKGKKNFFFSKINRFQQSHVTHLTSTTKTTPTLSTEYLNKIFKFPSTFYLDIFLNISVFIFFLFTQRKHFNSILKWILFYFYYSFWIYLSVRR